MVGKILSLFLDPVCLGSLVAVVILSLLASPGAEVDLQHIAGIIVVILGGLVFLQYRQSRHHPSKLIERTDE